MKTRVIFRKFRSGGDIIALFPHLPGTNDPTTMSCYQHLGQHGAMGERAVAPLTVTAVPSEYGNLLAELKRVGYDEIDIRMNLTAKDYSIRKRAIGIPMPPESKMRPYTVIGVYDDNNRETFTDHVTASSPKEATRIIYDTRSVVTIVDVFAGHHESLMVGL